MNKKNPRTHREPLQEDLARPLLNVSVSEGPPLSAWGRLEAARNNLALAVKLANKELSGNPLAEILAEHAMRLISKRGFPQILVDPDGVVMLEVHYEAPPKPAEPVEEVAEGTRKSALPSITILRTEAQSLGIDVAQFGKAKTRLIGAISAARRKLAAPKPAPLPLPPTKPPPSVVNVLPIEPERSKVPQPPARGVSPDNHDVIPDDDDDVSLLFKDATTASSPRRGTSTLPTTRKPAGRSLSNIVTSAESEVDLDALLSKPAPKLPEN